MIKIDGRSLLYSVLIEKNKLYIEYSYRIYLLEQYNSYIIIDDLIENIEIIIRRESNPFNKNEIICLARNKNDKEYKITFGFHEYNIPFRKENDDERIIEHSLSIIKKMLIKKFIEFKTEFDKLKKNNKPENQYITENI